MIIGYYSPKYNWSIAPSPAGYGWCMRARLDGDIQALAGSFLDAEIEAWGARNRAQYNRLKNSQ